MGGRPHARIACFMFVLVCGFPCSGQQSGSSGPRLATATRMVEVNATVTDEKGNSVGGLTQKDFKLFDDGQQQEIALFDVLTPKTSKTTALSLPPEYYSNYLNRTGKVPPSVSIILLDALNTSAMDQGRIREAVLEYLSQIQPTDHVALYILGDIVHGGRLRLVHDFTSDSTVLLDAVEKINSEQLSAREVDSHSKMESSRSASPEVSPVAAALRSFFSVANAVDVPVGFAASEGGPAGENGQAPTPGFQGGDPVEDTLAALGAIAQHARGLPGRKDLVWLAGRFPFSLDFTRYKLGTPSALERYERDVEQTDELLWDAGVAIYPVDARGLMGAISFAFTGGAADSTPKAPSKGDLLTMQANAARSILTAPTADSLFTMQEIARETGGVAFYNTNDIMGSIHRAVNDAQNSFLLGYYPAHHNWKGEFRKIQVKIDHKGLEVHARQGYFAAAEQILSAKDVQSTFLQSCQSSLDATGILVTAKVAPNISKDKKLLLTTVYLNLRNFQFDLENGQENADLQYGLFENDANGKAIFAHDFHTRIVLSPSDYTKGLEDGSALRLAIPAEAGANSLCVALRDGRSGKLGTLHIRLADLQATAGN